MSARLREVRERAHAYTRVAEIPKKSVRLLNDIPLNRRDILHVNTILVHRTIANFSRPM